MYISVIRINNFEHFSNIKLKNSTAVIAGCAKDIESYVRISTSKMTDIGNLFEDYKIIIFENDSKDNTLNLLKIFEKNNKNVIIISEKGLNKKPGFTRTCKLAHARNKIIEYVEDNNLTNYDYFINMDMDERGSEKLNIQNLKEILEDNSFNDWAVITANQEKYYDFWALRTNKNNLNCWSSNGLCFKGQMDLKNWFNNNEYHKFNDNSINENSTPISVLSAFGGLGIYKMEYIKGCRYNSNKIKNLKKRNNDCEHVSFHKCILNKGGKIYIHPKLINS